MGYYIRVLGKEPSDIAAQELCEVASPALIEGADGEVNWTQLELKHKSGEVIAVIEKNPIREGTLGQEELQEFIEEVRTCEPQSAARWLEQYLPNVKVIYAFQLLKGTDIKDGWSILHRVYGSVWKTAGGILQSDGEGFTNEDGYTIVWQFSPDVTGSWSVGILNAQGVWENFEIDLGNTEHREAFCAGRIPAGARPL